MSSFLNLLVTQLENQDPLDPMDDSSFYAQIAQLGTVQGIDEMTASMDTEEAVSLVGKEVTATETTSSSDSSTASTITGLVEGVTVSDGVTYLDIQGSDGNAVQVKASAVQAVGPSVDMSSSAYLIGKTVTGAYATTSSSGSTTYTAVTGTVTKAFTEGGVVMLNVEDSSGDTYSIGLNTVESVSSS
jgi:flagellar basal-body rod modification protein FlgD